MPKYVQPIFGLRVEKALAAALPVPAAAGDGVDINDGENGWRRRSGAGYTKALVALFADGAANVTDAALYAYGPYGIGGANVWMKWQDLPAAIALTATAGWCDVLDLPSIFDRLAIAGTIDANNVGYTATPVSEDIG